MRGIFIGPFRFWAIWIAVLGALYLAGGEQLHVTSFAWFLVLLVGLAAAGVLAVVFTTRRGERVTRDPIEPGGDG
ncbi:MAG: hypothetical protein GEU92_11360 [Alphaproteobacteria bacterium]|nr:hypothetical protein [Alphaproteobacteria bacterium]